MAQKPDSDLALGSVGPDAPEPLTPADCDLRGHEWMPLYGDRLLSSDTWLLASPEGRCSALTLWWASWKMVPAASLPNSERALAQLAGYGLSLKQWQAVRDSALRGWILCSDGRLYHPVVADLALLAWDRRVKERDRKAKWRGIKAGQDAGKPVNGAASSAPRPGDMDGDGTGAETSSSALKGKGEGKGEGEESYKKELMPDSVPEVGPAPELFEAGDAEPPPAGDAKRAKPRKADRLEPEGFADFYQAYPRHEGRAKAAEAFPAAVKAAGSVEALMGHLAAQRFSQDPQFVPHPATWLNQRRWRDGEGVTAAPKLPNTSGRVFDGRYFDRDPAEVAALPEPTHDGPERNAYWDAIQGLSTAYPGTRSGTNAL